MLARGVASEVLDDEQIERLSSLPVRPWSNPEARDRWVRVSVTEVSGRRIVQTLV